MGLARRPDSRLATEILPPPLYRALTHVFSHGADGVMLVGGTALAGYYAGHRRSDDLDLFTDSMPAHRAVVLAARSLEELGCTRVAERTSAHFYHATCELDGHDFTVQVVLDSNLFAVGSGASAGDGVVVADLETLLKMKAATLVSRASEKDLYDLAWLFAHARRLDIPALIAMGGEVDGGMNGEAVLIGLVGTEMREAACRFSLTESPAAVLARVTRVRAGLIRGLERYLRGQPAPPIAALIQKLS
ncbi:MAG: nucleotidyl transferase AbiEii/AbiGii toxin family protein [Acidobacteriota bacterium]